MAAKTDGKRRLVIVESPTTTGLIVVRALAPEPSQMPMAQRALAGAKCQPL